MTLHKKFLTLAIPNILSNLAVPLAGIIDIALLGHLSDIAPLAGVALATIIFDYIYWSFGFLRMGTTGLTAKAFGSNEEIECAALFSRSFSIAIVIGLILLALQTIISDVSFSLLQGSIDVKTSAMSYYSARIWAAPATLGLYAINGWLLGMHKSGYVLIIAIILNSLNILLDWIFIYLLNMEAAGAGYATMIASYISASIGFIIVIYNLHPLKKAPLHIIFSRGKIKELINLNINLLIRTFFLISVFAFFTNISSMFGAIVLAANTICLKIITIAAYFIDGFAFALEAMAGNAFGAKKVKDLQRILTLTLTYTLASLSVFSFIIFFSGHSLYALFASTEHHLDVILLGTSSIPYVIITLFAAGCAYVYDGFFIGIAHGAVLRRSMITATILGFIPLATLAVFYKSNVLLWFALILFMLLRSITLWLQSKRVLQCISSKPN